MFEIKNQKIILKEVTVTSLEKHDKKAILELANDYKAIKEALGKDVAFSLTVAYRLDPNKIIEIYDNYYKNKSKVSSIVIKHWIIYDVDKNIVGKITTSPFIDKNLNKNYVEIDLFIHKSYRNQKLFSLYFNTVLNYFYRIYKNPIFCVCIPNHTTIPPKILTMLDRVYEYNKVIDLGLLKTSVSMVLYKIKYVIKTKHTVFN